MTFLLILAIIFVLAPVAQAYAKRLNPPEVKGVNPRELARLREELDQLVAQVNRLQDEQSFMLKVLTEGDSPATLRSRPAERRLPDSSSSRSKPDHDDL